MPQTISNNHYQEVANPTSSMLSSFENSLAENLSDQRSIIERIESKLHEILNRRMPQNADSGMKPEVPMDDTSTRLSRQMNRLVENNTNLERISKHLSEII